MKRLILLLVFLTGCATVQLDLPTGAWDVTGSNPRRWNAPISFGPYQTQSVDEGTRRSWLADLEVVQVAKADQGYHLMMGDLAVECHTREVVIGRKGVFVDTSLGREPLLVCGYQRRTGTRSALVLSRTGSHEPSFRGELRGMPGPAYEIRSLHRAAGGSIPSGEPFGYEIRLGEATAAIVETVNRGRVWIDPSEEANRDMLAAAAASLLLFREPDAGN
jgi:hypothetical protein